MRSPAGGTSRGAPDASPGAAREEVAAPAGRRPALRCDFCGQDVDSVRRVALDRGYDRLQTPHRELYACHPCSERKEQLRRGLIR